MRRSFFTLCQLARISAILNTTMPLALFEEVRGRLNDDARLWADLEIDENTVALWRRRKGIPEPKLKLLRAIAAELAADAERSREAGLAMMAEGLRLTRAEHRAQSRRAPVTAIASKKRTGLGPR